MGPPGVPEVSVKVEKEARALMGRRPTGRRLAATAFVIAAAGLLAGSIYVKATTVGSPAWIGLGAVGICLLLLALALPERPRRR
jgi:hypothetical protein